MSITDCFECSKDKDEDEMLWMMPLRDDIHICAECLVEKIVKAPLLFSALFITLLREKVRL